MTTIIVWVLLLTLPGYEERSAVVVDNIATERNCHGLGEGLAMRANKNTNHTPSYICMPVRKVVIK